MTTRPTPPADAQREALQALSRSELCPIGHSEKTVYLITGEEIKTIRAALSAPSREKELMECIRDLADDLKTTRTRLKNWAGREETLEKHAALIAEAKGEK